MWKAFKRHPVLWSLLAGIVLLAAGLAVAYRQLSRPLPESALPAGYGADVENGRMLYVLGGCISCHRGRGAQVELPAGGRSLKVPGDRIPAPNITPDAETGIGKWRPVDFVNAMKRGLGPGGVHYIPAFPYTSYAWMKTTDILDLFAYLKSLPAARNEVKRAEFTTGRYMLAFWKWLALPKHEFRPLPGKGKAWNRGAYLVLGPGHCGECHTRRNNLMLLDRSRWLAGGPHPVDKVEVPSLRNLIRRGRYKNAEALYQALKNGAARGDERMDEGGMNEVLAALAQLNDDDLRAIAEFLASLR